MTRWLQRILLISLVFLASCTRIPHRIDDLPPPDPISLVAKVQKNSASVQDLSASGFIVFHSQIERRTVLGIKIKYLSPDYLLLTIKGILGLNLGSLTLVKDRYYLKMYGSNTPFSGQIEDFDLPATFGFRLNGKELRALFSPLIEIKVDPAVLTLDKDLFAQRYLLTWSDSDATHKIWADPVQPLFMRELVLSAQGDTLWDKELEKTRRQGRVVLGTTWRLKLGEAVDRYDVKIELEQIRLNQGLTSDEFDVEAHVQNDSAEVKIEP
jgi:hypothetical protein